MIKIEMNDIKSDEVQVLKEAKTCSSYLWNSSFTNYLSNDEDVRKNNCFNSYKLKESENLLECGFGQVSFESPDYSVGTISMKTFFLMPDFTHFTKEDILI